MKKLFIFFPLFFFVTICGFAQNTRLKERNTIGWYAYLGTFALKNKLSIHTEYQWRRNNLIKDWQQGLLRIGLNYQATPKLQLRVGYAWAETFNYGANPLNSFGKDFTEHRIFEAATITDKIGIVDLSHRFMLEQRWIGRYSNANLTKEDSYALLHRLRYLFKLQIPLSIKKELSPKYYTVLYDEIFIGFGENVNENIFDQNRIGFLLGYNINKKAKLEIGYLNQTLQLGREINNRNLFQYNNGIILNTVFKL
jgi:hypothetical protein